MAISYATELANIAHQTDIISDAISAALVQEVVVTPHVYSENLPTTTNVVLFRKAGSLTAEAVTEATAYTPSASSELTDSTITVTAVKQAVATYLSVEAQQFSTVDVSRIATEQGRAIGRLLDDNVIALFTGLTNSVTASSILTVADIMQAAYKVRAALAGGVGANLVGVFDYKGVYEIQKELMQSAAAALSQAPMITLLTGLPQRNGFCGMLPGVEVYQTDGLGTSGSDDIAAVFNPATTFCGVYSPSVNTIVNTFAITGFVTEIGSYVFSHVAEWNDTAGCKVLSDT